MQVPILNLKWQPKEKVLKREEAFSNVKESDKILIRVLSDVPSFMWEDNTTKGPFKKEDVVFLSKKLGTLLINQKHAEEVKK